jgi:hypothetical protein
MGARVYNHTLRLAGVLLYGPIRRKRTFLHTWILADYPRREDTTAQC